MDMEGYNSHDMVLLHKCNKNDPARYAGLREKELKKALLLLSCILLFACDGEPSNLYECRMEASRAPTERGVTVAAIACGEKFKAEQDAEQSPASNWRDDEVIKK